MKKIISLIFFFVVLMTSSNVLAAREVKVDFNSIEIEFDQPAIISEDRTLVPLRKIFETLGAVVEWDEEERKVTADKYGRIVSITIGSDELYVNGKAIKLDVPAKIINNRTLVPVRAISEAYDCEVRWNDKDSIVEIYDLNFINSPKKKYDNGKGLAFEYFSECLLTEEGENAVSLKSGNGNMTISIEKSHEVVINDSYLNILETGLKNGFSTIKIDYIKKVSNKNIAMIKCRNRGNVIYYMYGYKNGQSYNIAITLPEGTNAEKTGKFMYVMKGFMKNW